MQHKQSKLQNSNICRLSFWLEFSKYETDSNILSTQLKYEGIIWLEAYMGSGYLIGIIHQRD